MEESAFWSTVAQVVPVLLVALIIEWRYLARDLADQAPEDFRRSRDLRAAQAIVFAISCFALFVAFSTAIAALAAGDAETWHKVIAVCGVGIGLGTAFLGPAMSLASALVGDILLEWRRRLPWSAVSRDAAKYAELRNELFDETRSMRSNRLAYWADISKSYIALSKRLRDHPALSRADVDLEYSKLEGRRQRLIANRLTNEEVQQQILDSADDFFAGAKHVGEEELEVLIAEMRRLGRQVS